MLLVAALLSNASLRMEFRHRLSMFGDLIDPKKLFPIVVSVSWLKTSYNVENIQRICVFFFQESNVAETTINDVLEIPIKSCSSLETIAAVTVDELNNIELIQIPTSATINDSVILTDDDPAIIKHELNDSIELQTDIDSMGLDSIRIVNEDASIQNLELIDCQIELMDQFNLTDHIELSNDDVYQEDDDYLRVENICDMPDIFNIYQNSVMVEDDMNASKVAVDSYSPILSKRSKMSHKVKKTNQSAVVNMMAIEKDDDVATDGEVNENFASWLDSVIETINTTMDYAGNGCPEPLVFRIPHVRLSYPT